MARNRSGFTAMVSGAAAWIAHHRWGKPERRNDYGQSLRAWLSEQLEKCSTEADVSRLALEEVGQLAAVPEPTRRKMLRQCRRKIESLR